IAVSEVQQRELEQHHDPDERDGGEDTIGDIRQHDIGISLSGFRRSSLDVPPSPESAHRQRIARPMRCMRRYCYRRALTSMAVRRMERRADGFRHRRGVHDLRRTFQKTGWPFRTPVRLFRYPVWGIAWPSGM